MVIDLGNNQYAIVCNGDDLLEIGAIMAHRSGKSYFRRLSSDIYHFCAVLDASKLDNICKKIRIFSKTDYSPKELAGWYREDDKK